MQGLEIGSDFLGGAIAKKAGKNSQKEKKYSFDFHKRYYPTLYLRRQSRNFFA
jgi:hypothetical protein